MYDPYPNPELLTEIVGILYGAEAREFVRSTYQEMADQLKGRQQAMAGQTFDESDLCISRASPAMIVLKKISDFPPYDSAISSHQA